MSDNIGYCGSCVFSRRLNEGVNGPDCCKIWEDPTVQDTYNIDFSHWQYGVCSKYQLNPAALQNN